MVVGYTGAEGPRAGSLYGLKTAKNVWEMGFFALSLVTLCMAAAVAAKCLKSGSCAPPPPAPATSGIL